MKKRFDNLQTIIFEIFVGNKIFDSKIIF